MYKSFKPEDLMAVLEGISDSVVKLDGNANYLAMNGTAADIFRRLGRDPRQMLGKSLWELFPDVKNMIVERKIREALEQHVLAEHRFAPDNSLTGPPLRSAGGHLSSFRFFKHRVLFVAPETLRSHGSSHVAGSAD